MTPDQIAEFDEDEFRAFSSAVKDRIRVESWSHTEELLATAVEALWGLHARLAAGVPTVMVTGVGSPQAVTPYPRPDWLAPVGDGIPTITPRELAMRYSRKGR